MKQDQFLNVIDRDEAERRFHAVLDLRPFPAETVALAAAHDRVLAADVTAPVDVPGFDRSNMDGFAVRAQDTFGSSEDRPRILTLNDEQVTPGWMPSQTINRGEACVIATGSVIPRGADAVVMIEDTDETERDGRSAILVKRPATPGVNITYAGTDIGHGEVVLRHGERLTSRETGVLAALGVSEIEVIRCPTVAILSTGSELIPPGELLPAGCIYDSNSTIIADAVRELGAEPVMYGIVPDDVASLETAVRSAMQHDMVLLSGGTSKGQGDLSYRVVGALGEPGIVAHGIALKPGKPLCLAAVHSKSADGTVRNTPIAILPGFPTSAIFTFHEFIAPVLTRWTGRIAEQRDTVQARLPMRVNSAQGRTEYLLVGLVQSDDEQYTAFPMGKGSGSVTAFSRADGFVVIPRQQEYLEAGDNVQVHMLGAGLQPADLVVIGSHCVGLDFLLGKLRDQNVRSKFLAVGSAGGLEAVRRNECDLAGVHLFDPQTQQYNRPFLTSEMVLIPGYKRLQGLIFRHDDSRFATKTLDAIREMIVSECELIMVNRNRGSGTRVLIDQFLNGNRPVGYSVESRSHNAVAAAVVQGRADWGVTISNLAKVNNLGFLPLQEEQYDFVTHISRQNRPPIATFVKLLEEDESHKSLELLGFRR